MLTQWQEWQKRYDDISQELMSPLIEQQKRQELQKEHSYLGNLLAQHREIEALTPNL